MLVQPSRKALTPSFPGTLNWEVAAALAAELAGEASQRLWEVGALREQSSLPVQGMGWPPHFRTFLSQQEDWSLEVLTCL